MKHGEEYFNAVICCAKMARKYSELQRNRGLLVVPRDIEDYIIENMLLPRKRKDLPILVAANKEDQK